MPDAKPPIEPTDEPASSLAGVAHYLLSGGLFLVALCGGIGLIVLFDRIGSSQGIGLLRFAGLAIDIGLLAGLMVLLHRREHPLAATLGPMLALLVVVLCFAVLDWLLHRDRAYFWSMRNVINMAVQSSTVAVAALGMTLIIIAGGIDLSAGTAISLCATVLAFCLKDHLGVAVAIPACIFCGTMAGVINGALVSLKRVVPFIITLGTMMIYLGLAKLVAHETTVHPGPDTIPGWLPYMMTPVSEAEFWLVYPILPNFGQGVWLALTLAMLVAGMLHFTVFGRHVFAIGSNEATARLCGINVPLTKILVYSLAGVFVGVAGMYQFARLSSGSPTSGIGKELEIITAVVIGGGSLRGGRGSILGTLSGAVLMLVINSGCTSLGLSNAAQNIVIGAILVAAAILDQFRNRATG